MKLSIITINYNNAAGLRKTMESVLAQSSRDFEYIVVDGGSKDGSKVIIAEFADSPLCQSKEGISIHWVSEPDSGIYNAMNKGIRMAKGEYVQFLNSGDILASKDITVKMLESLEQKLQSQLENAEAEIPILYGNMLKMMPNGLLKDKGFAGRQPTMLDFYRGTLNHSPAYIQRSLFDQYGFYNESLRIVSDWKWYLEVIILGNTSILYVDMDVTVFDMSGISNSNASLEREERQTVLGKILPPNILIDYETWSRPIQQLVRMKSYRLIYFIFYACERLLFKIDKFKQSITMETHC